MSSLNSHYINIVVVVKSVRKTVVIMVIRNEHINAGNEAWDDFEYLMCRADLKFKVDFRVNGAIGTIVTKWELIVFGK